MTTNKPEVVAWSWDYRGQLMLTTVYSRALELAEPPYPTEVEPLIRLADYQRLQADHERLQAERKELRTTLAESRANDLTAMGYLNQIRELVGADDFPDMVRRCEKLCKVADQYRRLIELGEDFQWENIIRVEISDFPSRADAIDAAMQGDK